MTFLPDTTYCYTRWKNNNEMKDVSFLQKIMMFCENIVSLHWQTERFCLLKKLHFALFQVRETSTLHKKYQE